MTNKLSYNDIYDHYKAEKKEVIEALRRAYECAYFADRQDAIDKIKVRWEYLLRRIAVKANKFMIAQEERKQ